MQIRFVRIIKIECKKLECLINNLHNPIQADY